MGSEKHCSFCEKAEDNVFLMFTKEPDNNICSDCVLELSKMLTKSIELQMNKNENKSR